MKKAALLNIDTPALHFYIDLAGVFMYDLAHAYGTEVNEMDEKDKCIKELEQQGAEQNERIAFDCRVYSQWRPNLISWILKNTWEKY